jgi:hypothetical protein
MRTRLALGTGIALALALASSAQDVSADTAGQVVIQSNAASVTQVGSGAKRGRIDGDIRLRYPGFEQTTVVATKGHIVMITMEAVREQGQGPVQCSCSSYELRADGPPRAIVDLKRLTSYSNGERTCNHPKAAADEKGNIVWGYGSDYQSNRPNTYAGILNHKCETLAAPKVVNIVRDANDGAFDIAYLGNGRFVAGYYSDGGGGGLNFPKAGGRASIVMGLAVQDGSLLPTLERTFISPVIYPTNIGRPTVTAVDQNRALLCAGKGPDRPSDHVECALVDMTKTGVGVTAARTETQDGQQVQVPGSGSGANGAPGPNEFLMTDSTVWKAEVAKGNREKRIYFNQPTIAKISDNEYALMAIESNGMGKNTNVKGANVAHLFALNRTGDSITIGGEIVGAAAHQTHASICVGPYGEQGAATVGVLSAAPTGIGRAAMAMVSYDPAVKQFKYDERADLWPAAWYGDSGHLSNWYGRNPLKQGRDFMRCIGGVENPGYHQPNGYMADVKTFFAAAVHGRIPGDEKNSLFLSLVPGQMDKKPLPQNPLPAGEKPLPTEDSTPKTDTGPQDSGGCGCTTPGRTVPGNGVLLAGLGAAIAVVVSRRRRR